MSFSTQAKHELLKAETKKRCCQTAELFGAACFCVHVDDGAVSFIAENEDIAKRISYLVKKVFSVDSGKFCAANSGRGGKNTALRYKEPADVEVLKKGLFVKEAEDGTVLNIPGECVESECCKKAFVRGAFLTGGYIMPPEAYYHLEFSSRMRHSVDFLSVILDGFMLNPKIVARTPYFVAYFKNGDAIEEMLALIGANQSVMEFMNTRILKEKRNEINRRVNFETANMDKTTTAATKLIRDIETIMDTVGLDAIGEELQQAALCRLANPEASLSELSKLLGLSRSGVNHRLKKLSELAEELL